MLEVRTTPAEGRVVLALDEAACARDAVYAAAFAFIDRCWVHLDRVDGGRLEVTLRSKRAAGEPAAAELDALAAQFEDELLGQGWREKLLDDNRALLESIALRAFGPTGAATSEPGALDDLLAGASDDNGAFDDPLGIAMSWEEKYAKKDGAPGGGAPETPGRDGGDAS